MTDSEPLVPEALLRHESFLRNLAYGLLRDQQQSEDVVQATWLAAMEERTGKVSNPRAWLASVARNIALSLSRSNRRRDYRERVSAKAEALPSTEQLAEREHMLRSVTDSVLELDEPYRSTIMLRFFEGYSAAEIAKRDGVPVATVRSRVARGLEKLRERLDREHGDRSTWCVALFGAIGGERIAASLGSAAAVGTGATAGALIMSPKLKLVLASVAVILGVFTFVQDPFDWFGSGGAAAPRGIQRSELVLAEDDADLEPAVALSEVERERGVAALDEHVAEVAVEPVGSVRARVTWHDGEPAADFPLKLVAWSIGDYYERQLSARTDDQGYAEFPDVVVGRFSIYPERGQTASGAVEAGEETLVQVPLFEGFTVRGRVVDGEGNSVAGAELWMSDSGNSTEATRIGASAPDGSFELRAMTDQLEICARHPNFGPSPASRAEGSEGDEITVRLVLQPNPAALTLLVRGDDERPIADAVVKVTEGYCEPAGDAQRTGLWSSLPFEGRTSDSGELLVDTLGAGSIQIEVLAAGWAPASETISVEAGRTARHVVRLQRGASVVGIARSVEGDPLAGVSIQAGGYADLTGRGALTGDDGRFLLRGIPAGAVALTASLRELGKAETQRALGDGEVFEWNPVLDAGRVLAGRLVDERGEPLVQWAIHAALQDAGPASRFASSVRTNDAGEFRIVNCPEEPLTLTVFERSRGAAFHSARFEGLSAPSRDHELVILDAWRADARITGRLVGTDGNAAAGELTLHHPQHHFTEVVWADVETGEFTLGLLAPGSYRLTARLGDDRAELSDIEVTAGETRRIGDVRLGGPGTLTVVVEPTDDLPLENVAVHLVDDRDIYVTEIDATSVRGIELSTGDYELRIGGRALGQQIPVEIRSGEATRIVVEVQRAQRVPVAIDSSNFDSEPGEIAYLVRDANGEVVHEASLWLGAGSMIGEHYFSSLRLPSGNRFSVELTHESGITALIEITETELSADWRTTSPLVVVMQ